MQKNERSLRDELQYSFVVKQIMLGGSIQVALSSYASGYSPFICEE
jgi:hypothetical protein